VISLAEQHGLTVRLQNGLMLRAWSLAAKGRIDEALDELGKSITALSPTPFETPRIVLAETYGLAGRAVDGLKIADSLLTFDLSDWRRSEIYRVRGDLLLCLDSPRAADAEESFRHAIKDARECEAKSLELQATTSLARLMAKQGKRDEARVMLAEIYGWFTEGFDTADLKDAKALLEELSS
jgi:predicted ATPase